MNSLDNGTALGDFYGFAVPDFQFRQNAIADLDGNFAAWTGESIAPLYESEGTFETAQNDQGSSDERFAYSAQGNVVTNTTVSSLILGFEGQIEEIDNEQDECDDLAARLMQAMLAVQLNGDGDERCIRADFDPMDAVGTPAAGAFLKVEAADGIVVVDIVIGLGLVDPTIELKEQYDEWRAKNPCAAPNATAPLPPLVPTSAPTSASKDDPDSGSAGVTRMMTAPLLATAFLAMLIL